MKNYPQIISKVENDIWGILPEHLHAMHRVLLSQLSGEYFTVRDAEEAAEPEVKKSTAIIPVYGVIGQHLSLEEIEYFNGCDVGMVGKWLDMADRAEIENVILDFRSPGGTITGVPELAKKVARLASERNVVAFSDSLMTSAAYWFASQANTIYLTETARAGSIGIYALYMDVSRALENTGVKVNAISAGDQKLAGAPFRAMSETERARFQARVDKTWGEFKAAVSAGRRGVKDEDMQGQVFDGREAVAAGLADGVVDDIEEVIEMMK